MKQKQYKAQFIIPLIHTPELGSRSKQHQLWARSPQYAVRNMNRLRSILTRTSQARRNRSGWTISAYSISDRDFVSIPYEIILNITKLWIKNLEHDCLLAARSRSVLELLIIIIPERLLIYRSYGPSARLYGAKVSALNCTHSVTEDLFDRE